MKKFLCVVVAVGMILSGLSVFGASKTVGWQSEKAASSSLFSAITSSVRALAGTPAYTTATWNCTIKRLWGNQYSGRAYSSALDQNGDPYNIDRIYAKVSLYKKPGSSWLFISSKIDDLTDSSDAAAEKITNIVTDPVRAVSNHKFEEAGYLTKNKSMTVYP